MLVLIRWHGRTMAVPAIATGSPSIPDKSTCRGHWRLALLGVAGLLVLNRPLYAGLPKTHRLLHLLWYAGNVCLGDHITRPQCLRAAS